VYRPHDIYGDKSSTSTAHVAVKIIISGRRIRYNHF
jgi:hypothetical protein